MTYTTSEVRISLTRQLLTYCFLKKGDEISEKVI